MLGSHRVFFALALVTAASAAAAGCGGDTNGTGGSGGQGGSTTTTSSTTSSSTSSSTSSNTGGSGPTCLGDNPVMVVYKLYFGDGNNGQWKKFGHNIDGLTTDGASADVCKPNSGGKPGVAYPDGEDGIDNSFGKNLLPQIIELYPNWTTDINNTIANGISSVLLKLECLPPTGDYDMITTKLYGGTPLGTIPKFDGTDKWPVSPELLMDTKDPQSSAITFEGCTVKDQKFESGSGATFVLTVPVTTETNSRAIKLTLRAAKLTMTLSEDRKSAMGGMIGGVLDTEEFVAEVKKIGDLLGICNNGLFTGLVQQIRQASDIMSDGTQDPTKTCNGITMGLGFELRPVQIGDVGPITPVGKGCP